MNAPTTRRTVQSKPDVRGKPQRVQRSDKGANDGKTRSVTASDEGNASAANDTAIRENNTENDLRLKVRRMR